MNKKPHLTVVVNNPNPVKTQAKTAPDKETIEKPKGNFIRMPRQFYNYRLDNGEKNPIYENMTLQSVYFYLVNKANWCDGTKAPRGMDRPLIKGELITTAPKIHKKLTGGMSHNAPSPSVRGIRYALSALCKKGLILTKNVRLAGTGFGTQYTLVRVCNYEGFFGAKKTDGTASGNTQKKMYFISAAEQPTSPRGNNKKVSQLDVKTFKIFDKILSPKIDYKVRNDMVLEAIEEYGHQGLVEIANAMRKHMEKRGLTRLTENDTLNFKSWCEKVMT